MLNDAVKGDRQARQKHGRDEPFALRLRLHQGEYRSEEDEIRRVRIEALQAQVRAPEADTRQHTEQGAHCLREHVEHHQDQGHPEARCPPSLTPLPYCHPPDPRAAHAHPVLYAFHYPGKRHQERHRPHHGHLVRLENANRLYVEKQRRHDQGSQPAGFDDAFAEKAEAARTCELKTRAIGPGPTTCKERAPTHAIEEARHGGGGAG